MSMLLISCGRGDATLRQHLEGLGLHVRVAQPTQIRLSHEVASTLLLVVAPSCEEALRSGSRLPPLALPTLVLAGGAWQALRMASSVTTAVSAWMRLAPHHGLGTDLGPAGRMPLYEVPGAMLHGVPAAGARIVAHADHARPGLGRGPYAVAFTIEAAPLLVITLAHREHCSVHKRPQPCV